LDEELAATTADYERSDLPDRHKAALRLADALMTQPGSIDGGLAAELRRHFRPEQLLELTLDVMKWNYQKVPVALGTDDEIHPGELADLVFDDHGHFIRPG
jgi:hypothetical protein